MFEVALKLVSIYIYTYLCVCVCVCMWSNMSVACVLTTTHELALCSVASWTCPWVRLKSSSNTSFKDMIDL